MKYQDKLCCCVPRNMEEHKNLLKTEWCIYYKGPKHRCDKGHACGFAHYKSDFGKPRLPKAQQKAYCAEWLQTGTCSWGDKCQYRHEYEYCGQWLQTNSCWRGDKCKYLHEYESKPGGQSLRLRPAPFPPQGRVILTSRSPCHRRTRRVKDRSRSKDRSWSPSHQRTRGIKDRSRSPCHLSRPSDFNPGNNPTYIWKKVKQEEEQEEVGPIIKKNIKNNIKKNIKKNKKGGEHSNIPPQRRLDELQKPQPADEENRDADKPQDDWELPEIDDSTLARNSEEEVDWDEDKDEDEA